MKVGYLIDASVSMTPKQTIEFQQANAPITEPVTKFGGQPVWLEAPEWPQSRQLKKPMRFIGQIALDPKIFGETSGKMAYLFMTDEDDYVDGTWEADGGENAVIIQPGGNNPPSAPLTDGPTLSTSSAASIYIQPGEFAVTLTPGEDADDMDDSEETGESKIGGVPAFIQGEEYPAGDGWRFFLQLDSTSTPFDLNFGDAGVGYAFLSADGRSGKFLWQCG